MTGKNQACQGPPGLVAYWAFEGNGRDSVGHNDLTTGDAGDMTYDEGKVGQAMSQTGNNPAFQLPGIAGIDFNHTISKIQGRSFIQKIN